MSLYVNAALGRTRSSYVYPACRSIRSNQEPSFLTFSGLARRSRQQSSHLIAVWDPSPTSKRSQHARTSLIIIGRSVRTTNTPSHAARLTTYRRNGANLHTSATVQDSTVDDATPEVDIVSPATLGRASQSAFCINQKIPDETFDHSYQGELTLPLTRTTISPNSYPCNLVEGDEIDHTQYVQEEARRKSSRTKSRWLPALFQDYLTQLGELISEQRGIEAIQTTFSESIVLKDNLLRIHGDALREWLSGSWDRAKATQIVHLALGSITTSPQHAITVLQCLDEVEGDFWFRSRCLSFIGRIHKDLLVRDAEMMASFQTEVDKLRVSSQWPRQRIRHQDMSLMLWGLNTADAEKLIQRYVDETPEPLTVVRVWLAMYCARHRMDSLALSLLTSLPSQDLHSPSQLVLQCCHVLLGHDVVELTDKGHNFKLLPQLLEHGLTPDSMLYSQIIERAFDSGYPGVAWDVFRHLQGNKLGITGRTYFLLLRHAFNENNIAGVQEIMQDIQCEDALQTSLPLLHYSLNIVRRIFHYERAMTTAESLSHMLALYDRVFSREPLSKLEILPPHGSTNISSESPTTKAGKQLEAPDDLSLSFTIWAHVLCHRSGKHTQKLWKRIQDLVEAGDTAILKCMRHDLIYNAFIWVSLREPGTMAGALEILQYMLAKQLCMPTDRTWSILICGFLRHDQKAQAQHIFGLMKQCDLSLGNIRKEYWRRDWTFEYFQENLDAILDEDMMPDGTETGGIATVWRPDSKAARGRPKIELDWEGEVTRTFE